MNYYPARAVVDLDHIRANTAKMCQYAPSSHVMAVIKADAYGHGLLPVAKAALAGGATWLGTAQLCEGLALRAAGFTVPILSWLSAPGAPFSEAIAANIDLSVPAAWTLREIEQAARALGKQARIHLKIDTGLGRGGAFLGPWTKLLEDAVRLQAAGIVKVVGVWSHFASADEAGRPGVAEQLAVFREAINRAEAAGAELEVRHIANSAATIAIPEAHFDLVRPGISLYGLSPMPGLQSETEIGITPAMRLEARVHLVKEAPAGQGVSYGHTYHTSESTTLADIPLGYGDGIPRVASNKAPVYLGGAQHVIAGRVCMDQFVLDLGPDTQVREGDVAILFGTGRMGEPTANDWARAAQTISYEIVTRLGVRIPRVYVGQGA